MHFRQKFKDSKHTSPINGWEVLLEKLVGCRCWVQSQLRPFESFRGFFSNLEIQFVNANYIPFERRPQRATPLRPLRGRRRARNWPSQMQLNRSNEFRVIHNSECSGKNIKEKKKLPVFSNINTWNSTKGIKKASIFSNKILEFNSLLFPPNNSPLLILTLIIIRYMRRKYFISVSLFFQKYVLSDIIIQSTKDH